MEIIIKSFGLGLIILFIAILANILANILGLSTWYSLINNLSTEGLIAFRKENIFSLIFLFFIYPLILGLTAYFSIKYIF